MEEELFVASSKSQDVKAVGILLGHKLENLHIFVNGVDITKNFVLEEVRITAETKPQDVGVVLSDKQKSE